jgi:hypothetical protein
LPAKTPGRRTAPAEVIRIEESTDPKRRARLQALSRRPTASRRLRAHLTQIAELQKTRRAAESPTVDDPPTVKETESRDPIPVPATAH